MVKEIRPTWLIIWHNYQKRIKTFFNYTITNRRSSKSISGLRLHNKKMRKPLLSLWLFNLFLFSDKLVEFCSQCLGQVHCDIVEKVGVWNQVSDAFSVPLLENAPKKCAFTNHLPRPRLKVVSITRTELCAWKVGMLIYTVSRLSKCQGWLSITCYFTVAPPVASLLSSCTVFLSLNSDVPKLLAFSNCIYPFTWWRLPFFICVWPKPCEYT